MISNLLVEYCVGRYGFVADILLVGRVTTWKLEMRSVESAERVRVTALRWRVNNWRLGDRSAESQQHSAGCQQQIFTSPALVSHPLNHPLSPINCLPSIVIIHWDHIHVNLTGLRYCSLSEVKHEIVISNANLRIANRIAMTDHALFASSWVEFCRGRRCELVILDRMIHVYVVIIVIITGVPGLERSRFHELLLPSSLMKTWSWACLHAECWAAWGLLPAVASVPQIWNRNRA